MAILYTAARDSNENRYEGLVLAKVVDQSYRIMSDVWGTADFARVWDEATAGPKMILVNVYDMNPESWRPVQITVDATDEIREKYNQWQINLEFQRRVGIAESEVLRIEKGCIAKVVKGKNGKGTVGKVVVQMQARYGMGWRASVENKLGIATSDVTFKKALPNGKVVDAHRDMVWVWQRNCERVDVAKIDKDAILEQVKAEAARSVSAQRPALQRAA
jgi:hypothetical protein